MSVIFLFSPGVKIVSPIINNIFLLIAQLYYDGLAFLPLIDVPKGMKFLIRYFYYYYATGSS